MNDDILDRLQADVHALLGCVPSLSWVTLIKDDSGDIENEVQRKLQTLTDAKGKIGLAIIVFAPEVVNAERNLPGPVMKVEIEIQVIEHVLFNRDLIKGTGIRAAVGALRVLRALHRQSFGDVILYAEKDPVKKAEVKKGYVSHIVKLNIFEIGLDPAAKPLGVTAAVEDDFYVLSCATEGATIYYTTDGSLPVPGGAGSMGYTEPMDLPAGTEIRAFAFVAGMQPGDVLSFKATA